MLLFCVTEGALHVEVEGCAQTVRAGQALVIDCRRPHHYEAAGNLWFRWAGFWGMASEAYHGLLQERFGGPADLAAPSQAAACAEALFAQLRAERHAEHAVSAAVHMLLSALADMRTGTPGAAEQAVDRAAAFLPQAGGEVGPVDRRQAGHRRRGLSAVQRRQQLLKFRQLPQNRAEYLHQISLLVPIYSMIWKPKRTNAPCPAG